MNVWIPYVITAILSGLINCLVAWFELEKKCRRLPFFEPIKNFGFWLWFVLQLSVPSLVSWFILSLSSKPSINFELIFYSIAIGIIFNGVLNITTEIGTLPINIKPFYELFINFSYELIYAQCKKKSAEFWVNLKEELGQNYININKGCDYLEEYCLNSIYSDEINKKEIENQLVNIKNFTNKIEQIKAIVILLKTEVNRQDLPTVMKQFNCRDTFIENSLKK